MEYCSKQTDTVEIHYETDEGKPILAKAYFNHTNEVRSYYAMIIVVYMCLHACI